MSSSSTLMRWLLFLLSPNQPNAACVPTLCTLSGGYTVTMNGFLLLQFCYMTRQTLMTASISNKSNRSTQYKFFSTKSTRTTMYPSRKTHTINSVCKRHAKTNIIANKTDSCYWKCNTLWICYITGSMQQLINKLLQLTFPYAWITNHTQLRYTCHSVTL